MALEIFKLVGSIFVDNDKANESISKTDEKAEGLGNKFLQGVGTAAKWGAGIATAAAAGAAALGGMAMKSADVADNIDEMSQKIGISRQAYQELDFICSQNGASVDGLKVGIKTLTNQMQSAAEGSKKAIGVFDELGLSWEDGNGKLKDQETMMWEAFSALQSMEDQTMKAALATDLFGKAGMDLMPMLNGAEGSIEAMKQQAHDMGVILSDEAIDAGATFADTMVVTKLALDAVITKIGAGVIPIFQKALDWVNANMPLIQMIMESVFKAIEFVVMSVGAVFEKIFEAIDGYLGSTGTTFEDVMGFIALCFENAVKFLSDIWNAVGKPVFDLIMTIVGTVAGYFAQKMPEIKGFVSNAFRDIKTIWENNLKPCFEAIGSFINNVLAPAFKFVFNNIIAPVVDAVFKTIKDLWDNFLKPVFTNIVDFIKNIFSGNFSGAFQNIINIVKGIWDGIISIVKTPINACIGIINKFIGGLNKLKIPDWIPGIGGMGINIPEIPLLAKGGNVFGAGKAIVGEAGAELVDLPAGARVTPLTGNGGDVLRADELVSILTLILEEIRSGNLSMPGIIQAALSGMEINWNDRELGRMVKTYA